MATDLLVDDYDGQPEAFEKARKIFNILGDRVETVTPWLAERVLAADKNGARVAWLTTPKAIGPLHDRGLPQARHLRRAGGRHRRGRGGLMAIDPCTEYGLALAVEDFVPVLLAGAGTVVLALAAGRSVPQVRLPALARRRPGDARRAAKAVWKLLVAAEPCRNIEMLEQLLFPCLAFGFAGIAWALASVRRERPAPWLPFLVVPVLAAVAALVVGGTWPLLIAAAIGAVTVGVLGILLARRRRDRCGVVLFGVYIVGTLVLPPLAGRPDQSQELQWIEQLTNSVVQLCFLLGAIGLLPRDRPVHRPP